MDDKMIRVAVYARVSSDQQAKACTIASQKAALKERIEEDGLSLEDELCFIDDGYVGGTLVRPALERLRDVVYAGGIDRLYVHSPDRLARKYAYQVLLVEELRRCGVEVVFLNRAIGTSPEEDLLLQVQGMIAEYERAKIMERSRRGKRHAARRGSVNVLSGAPYGYQYISKQEGGGQAHYQIILEEARVVRQVFEWVGRDGLSLGEVCRRLKSEGIRTRTGKTYWDRATVWGMLKNPAYKGSAGFGKTRIGERRPSLRPQRGASEQPRRAYSVYDTPSEQQESIPVPALVSEDLFAAVGEQLTENKKRNRQGKRGARYLLQGLLVCRCCGYAYYGKPVSRSAAKGKTRRYAYYRCIGTDAYRFGGERLCYNKQVRTDMLEETVWEDVRTLLNNPGRIEEEYQRRLDDRAGRGQREAQQLSRMVQKVKRGVVRLIDAYEDGLLEKSEFEPRITSAKERLARLEAEAHAEAEQEIKEKELRSVIGQLQEFAVRVEEGLHDPDWTTRREIIRALVKRVEIDKEQVRVVYKVSPPPFAAAPDSGGRLQDCWRCEGYPFP
jgi:site-specific DNA recombinase